MPDRKPKPDRATPHKDKLCKTCRCAIQWQKKYEQDWDIVKYCSEACGGYRVGEKDAELEAAIFSLLGDCAPNQGVSPVDAAKLVGGRDSRRDWEALLRPVRVVARRLAAAGRIEVVQHGVAVNPATAKGAIHLRLR